MVQLFQCVYGGRCHALYFGACIAHFLFVTQLDMVGPHGSLTIDRMVLCALLCSQSIVCLLSFTSDCFTSFKVQYTLHYSLTFYIFNKLGTTAHIATIIWYTSCTAIRYPHNTLTHCLKLQLLFNCLQHSPPDSCCQCCISSHLPG